VFNLATFGLTDILECSSRMRRLGIGESSMEAAAGAVVRYLYDDLVDAETGRPALALVRLYKTHRFDELEPDLQAFAEAVSPKGRVAGGAPCLTLLASAGVESDWNDRRLSKGHRAIPLHDSAAIAALPMVYRLTRDLGLADEDLVNPSPALFRATDGQPGGVFYVADARGSEHVPAQDDFVAPYGIRSVLGFGGLLPSGYAFAVVMFATVSVSREIAEAFAPLTFAAQLALLPFVERRLFESSPLRDDNDVGRSLRMARAEAIALGHLLDTRHHVVTEQAARLERARRDAVERAEALVESQRSLAASEAVKSAILHAALDAVITMDADGKIVDFNPAAERTFGYLRDEAVGKMLADLIVPPALRDAHRAGLAHFRATGEGPILGQRIEITALRADGTEFPVELAVAAVDAGGTRLFSGHIRDITERMLAEQALRDAGERYAEVARILQSSLLPRELPTVPGIELAATYHAGDEGLDVGGDFFDVFAAGDGRWGIVLGDVMGKGAEAAATTALARHTVRAAAIAADDPSAVLRLLNEALHRDDSDRFCTALFAFVEPGDHPKLRLASGGHPAPMLRRSATAVEIVASGALLGPFAEWSGVDVQLDLEPGDLVLFYSDGVTEARNGPDEFGSERLADCLSATTGLDADATITVLRDAVNRFSSTAKDDIAALAFRV